MLCMKGVLSSGKFASLLSQRYTQCVFSSKQASAAVSLAGASYRGIIQGFNDDRLLAATGGRLLVVLLPAPLRHFRIGILALGDLHRRGQPR